MKGQRVIFASAIYKPVQEEKYQRLLDSKAERERALGPELPQKKNSRKPLSMADERPLPNRLEL